MLKVVRVARLSVVIQSLNIRQDIKAYLKLCKLSFYIMIYIHIIACIYYYTLIVNKAWLPGLDFPYGVTGFYNLSMTKKYLNVQYHAVMLFGLNEVYPQATLDVIVFSIMLLISSMVNAHVFGVIAVLVSEANKGNQFEQFSTSNAAMSNLKVPMALQRKVKEYLQVTKDNQQHQEELQNFFNHISPSLKTKVMNHMFNEAVKLNDIFYEIKDSDPDNEKKIISQFVSKLTIKLAQPEDIIIEQGSALNSSPYENFFYMITKGECTVVSKDKVNFKDNHIRALLPGDHFGEVALLYKCKRTVSIV